MKKVSIIGPCVLDVLTGPLSHISFPGSFPMDYTLLSPGGDALNEAVILSRLQVKCELITKIGEDTAGELIRQETKREGFQVHFLRNDANVPTGINIVLVNPEGERCFLTNPDSTLRKFSYKDILPYIEPLAEIVSFASLFVSSELKLYEMEKIFEKLKEKKRLIVLDSTSAKHGERVEDLKGIFRYIDYFIPNEKELEILTGVTDPILSSQKCIDLGLNCLVLKLGSRGCLIRTKDTCEFIPAIPVDEVVDTTGAGDSFVAGFIYGLAQDYSLKDCAAFGNACASLIIEHPGSHDPAFNRDEVMKRFDRYYRQTTQYDCSLEKMKTLKN